MTAAGQHTASSGNSTKLVCTDASNRERACYELDGERTRVAPKECAPASSSLKRRVISWFDSADLIPATK